MIPKHFYQTALCCILTLLSACKDDNNSPLRFYNDTYEVPMGGIRYLGLESGNGDYSLEVKDQRLVSAQVEQGWQCYLRPGNPYGKNDLESHRLCNAGKLSFDN